MANPQKENGFVAVANEIWDILSLIRLTANEHRAIHLVLRLSYGCRQKACQFDKWEDFHCCAGIHKTTVGRILHGLEEKNIFFIDWEKHIIAFNKDYITWNIEPYHSVSPEKYAELIKWNLGAKKDIEDYAMILISKKRSDFAKSEVSTSRKANSKLAKCEVTLREKRIFKSVKPHEQSSEGAPKYSLNTEYTKEARARARAREGPGSTNDKNSDRVPREDLRPVQFHFAPEHRTRITDFENFRWAIQEIDQRFYYPTEDVEAMLKELMSVDFEIVKAKAEEVMAIPDIRKGEMVYQLYHLVTEKEWEESASN